MKIIELKKSVTASNDQDAAQLRTKLQEEKTVMVNVMSSPGAGKTTLIGRLIQDLSPMKIAVIEADLAGQIDAERVQDLGAKAIQAHTDGMCHMDAKMTKSALEELKKEGGSELVFLENVGNLICPAEYDTGASIDMMILSVPEGDDKPLKYPLMFEKSHVLVITKTDALSYFDFDLEKCIHRAKRLNKDIRVFPVSAKTGEGMEALEHYLQEAVAMTQQRSSC